MQLDLEPRLEGFRLRAADQPGTFETRVRELVEAAPRSLRLLMHWSGSSGQNR
jgi:hypothetical protein